MKIGIYQCEGKLTSKEENLAILREAAIAAAEQGARLIIFSELFLTGYNIGDTVFELAESINGPSAQKAADIAREADLAILYGYPEKLKKIFTILPSLSTVKEKRLPTVAKLIFMATKKTVSFNPGTNWSWRIWKA